MKKVRVGVIGAGAWGRNHVRTLAALPEAELVAVCDSSAAAREKVGRQFPAVEVTDSAAAVLGKVEAVVVATPAVSHPDLARMALDAGVAVLVEKPFALSVADAEDMANRASRSGVPLLAGHLLEYHPVVERLKEIVEGGSLGDVYYLYGQRVNLGQVRPDENALWSFGPHDVSVMLFVLGEVPSRVAATGKSFLQRGIEDVVFLTMEFASGIMAHVQLSWLDPHKVRRITIVGSRQMAVFDDMEAREKLRIYDRGVDRPPEYRSFGESLQIREGDIFIPRLPNVEPLAAELTHFLNVARGNAEARSDAADGVRVVRVLAAASDSLRRGGQPVEVGS